MEPNSIAGGRSADRLCRILWNDDLGCNNGGKSAFSSVDEKEVGWNVDLLGVGFGSSTRDVSFVIPDD
jgi:hypothetical protein